MKRHLRMFTRVLTAGLVVGSFQFFAFQSQAIEDIAPSAEQIVKQGELKFPNYDYIVVYPLENQMTSERSIELIQIDSQLGRASERIILHKSTVNGILHDIRINKKLTGFTYVTFEETINLAVFLLFMKSLFRPFGPHAFLFIAQSPCRPKEEGGLWAVTRRRIPQRKICTIFAG